MELIIGEMENVKSRKWVEQSWNVWGAQCDILQWIVDKGGYSLYGNTFRGIFHVWLTTPLFSVFCMSLTVLLLYTWVTV